MNILGEKLLSYNIFFATEVQKYSLLGIVAFDTATQNATLLFKHKVFPYYIQGNLALLQGTFTFDSKISFSKGGVLRGDNIQDVYIAQKGGYLWLTKTQEHIPVLYHTIKTIFSIPESTYLIVATRKYVVILNKKPRVCTYYGTS